MMVTKNDFLKQDELEILGEEFGIEVTVKDALEDVNYVGDYHDEDVDDRFCNKTSCCNNNGTC